MRVVRLLALGLGLLSPVASAEAQGGFFSALFRLFSFGEHLAPAAAFTSAASRPARVALGAELRAAASPVRQSFRTSALGPATRATPAFNLASGSTEVVTRLMSQRELQRLLSRQALTGTALLARPVRGLGNHFVTPAWQGTSALKAKRLLALRYRPQYAVQLRVGTRTFSKPTVVQPKYGMPGGGLERQATGTINIPVRVESFAPMKPQVRSIPAKR